MGYRHRVIRLAMVTFQLYPLVSLIHGAESRRITMKLAQNLGSESGKFGNHLIVFHWRAMSTVNLIFVLWLSAQNWKQWLRNHRFPMQNGFHFSLDVTCCQKTYASLVCGLKLNKCFMFIFPWVSQSLWADMTCPYSTIINQYQPLVGTLLLMTGWWFWGS